LLHSLFVIDPIDLVVFFVVVGYENVPFRARIDVVDAVTSVVVV
jgi:hypothetical protein